jgi:stearoyl-CoA desaturase (Delta-9 desaturase)
MSSTLAPPRPAAPVQGLEHLSPRQERFQRRTILFITVAPLVGLIAAVISLWGWGLTVADVVAFGIFYAFTGLGVTIGYHRLFTHRSFEAARPVRAILAVAGSMSLQGSVISWVSTHRRHHAYADKEGDPHSPHLETDGVGGIFKGLWHAHLGWLFSPEKTSAQRWAPDLLKDRDLTRIDKAFPPLAIASMALPAVAGLALTGTFAGGLRMFLWAGLVRIFLLHHVTWSVNSICHFYGKRPFETTDESTNNWMLSLISFGESWHNNHHAFPTSAVHGLGRWQIDLSGFAIKALERFRLARNVKGVNERQLSGKLP